MLKHFRSRMFLLAIAASGMLVSGAARAAAEMHMAPVLAQPVARGDIIQSGGLVMQEIKRPLAGNDYITSSEALIGMSAKRPLRAGVPLRASDITRPRIIAKGELVTVAFESPGLSLSIRGKALEDGTQGQAIRVMNTQTNRIFEGVATAAGYVIVPPATQPPSMRQTSRLEFSPPTTALPGR